MKKEIYYAGRWTESVPGHAGSAGVVIMPAGLPKEALSRRDRTRDREQDSRGLFALEAPRRLLDPQVYLADLQPEQCPKTCANLASYPWFSVPEAEVYDSGKMTQSQWRAQQRRRAPKLWRPPTNDTESIHRTVAAVVDFQRQVKCEALILPAPLTGNPSSDFSVELEWMDLGLAHAANVAPDMPAFVTVAVSDRCLCGIKPKDNTLIDIIVDQVTARSAAGIYFVLEQSYEQGYNCIDQDTVGSVLRFAAELKSGGTPRLIMSYCGLLGLAAVCVGADAWVTGWLKSERRLNLKDIANEDTPRSPSAAYYSHPLAGEINVAKDLPAIVKNGWLDLVADETTASADLLAAMRRNDAPPAEWRVKATRAAREHFMMSVVRETAKVDALPSDLERKNYATSWLANAAQVARTLRGIPNLNMRTEILHQRHWQDALVPYTGSSRS